MKVIYRKDSGGETSVFSGSGYESKSSIYDRLSAAIDAVFWYKRDHLVE